MVATKKKAASKAPAKKAPTKKKVVDNSDEITEAKRKNAEEVAERAAERAAKNDKLRVRVKELKDGGAKWDAIVEDTGVSIGKAMFLYEEASLKPKDRIKAADEDEMAAKIVQARDDGKQSWGTIMARTGLSEGRVRALYTSKAKVETRGLRVGRGGRFPSDDDRPKNGVKRKTAPAKPAAKKAPVKKASAPSEGSKAATTSKASTKTIKVADLIAMEPEALADTLTGKTVNWKDSDTGKALKAKIQVVDDITGDGANMVVQFHSVNDTEFNMPLSSVVRVAA